jgi:MFS family permease
VTDIPDQTLGERGTTILARLNRIPVWSLPRRYLLIIGIGYFFTFYDITDIGFAMPAIDKQFGLSGSLSLFTSVAIGLIGYIVGSFVIGTLADRYGRYRMLIFTIILTAIGSFGDAAAPGVTVLIIFRFITGVGVGADLNLVSTYIGELAPPARRGRISLYTFVVGIIGQAVTPFIALGLVPNLHIGWRLLFIIGGVIAVIGLVMRFQLPESPRWEVNHERPEAAARTVERMERSCQDRNITLAQPQPSRVSSQRGFPLRYLFQPPYSRRLAVFIPMWFLWYIGNYGFLGDAAELISEHGTKTGASIQYLAIGSIGYPVGALLMSVLVDRVERKLLITSATIVWLIGMVLIGSFANPPLIDTGTILASLALGSYLQVAYTYTAESFPTRARASGFAFSDGIGHAGGALGAFLLPVVVGSWSFLAGFTAIGVTGLAAGVIALAGPSATGQNLEHVSE